MSASRSSDVRCIGTEEIEARRCLLVRMTFGLGRRWIARQHHDRKSPESMVFGCVFPRIPNEIPSAETRLNPRFLWLVPTFARACNQATAGRTANPAEVGRKGSSSLIGAPPFSDAASGNIERICSSVSSQINPGLPFTGLPIRLQRLEKTKPATSFGKCT